jgi:hypothetical protein
MTNLLEIAPTMDSIREKEGGFAAVIAHSFGTIITSYALVNLNFPPPRNLVYFGAFNELLESLPRFQEIAKLPDEIMDGFRVMLLENFGGGVLETIINEKLVQQIDVPALMYQSVEERNVHRDFGTGSSRRVAVEGNPGTGCRVSPGLRQGDSTSKTCPVVKDTFLTHFRHRAHRVP